MIYILKIQSKSEGGEMVFISSHYPVMLYICTMFPKNISKGFRVIEKTHDFQPNFSKGHNSVKKVELWFFICAQRLIILCICTKIRENISVRFSYQAGKISLLEFQRGIILLKMYVELWHLFSESYEICC